MPSVVQRRRVSRSSHSHSFADRMDPLSSTTSPAMEATATEVDLRLLEAASSGQTDLILQLLEEEGGQRLHSFKDQVSHI